MKTLIPTYSFFPAQEGGPSNALYWLASGLAANGHNVKVVTTNRYINDPNVEFDKWIRVNGFDVIYTTKGNLKKQILSKELTSCELIISNGVCSLSNLIFNFKALLLNKKVIISPRGELLSSAINHKGRLYGWIKMLCFELMHILYGNRVLFHATSEEEIASIKKYMGNQARICLIPNYMILPEKVKDIPRDSVDYLLYVGRINQIKNLDILIDAVSQSILFRKSGIKLFIAGENKGEYYNTLVKQIERLGLSEKVSFLGMVTGEDKDLLFSKAKCLLLLSKSENFGNVVIEALSQGTPVIASKGTPWSKLIEFDAGYWVEADSKVVADCIDDLLSKSTEEYCKMRECSYAFSRLFDIYANMNKWEEAIKCV